MKWRILLAILGVLGAAGTFAGVQCSREAQRRDRERVDAQVGQHRAEAELELLHATDVIVEETAGEIEDLEPGDLNVCTPDDIARDLNSILSP